MAKQRKDKRGRALQKGEVQRKDGRYSYAYNDRLGRRKYIYSMDLAELRKMERELVRDQLDGLDTYVGGKATINDAYDRYMHIKASLRPTTRRNYEYTYDHFIRYIIGFRRLADIHFSDVLSYYYYLLNEKDLAIATVDNVNTLLHPIFEMAVRDDIIRRNPTDGALHKIKSESDKAAQPREALTIEQQRRFMVYIAEHPVYYTWWPLFTILLGTGMRISECIGLTWDDVDLEKRAISVNHSLVMYPTQKDSQRLKTAYGVKSEKHISRPKTVSGIRTIPIMDTVKDAFDILREEQEETGYCTEIVDGLTNFVFMNRYGEVQSAAAVNRAIKRVVESCNADEELNAKKERRQPVIVPYFSCHILRHTFCTRLCETETNIKAIQSIMGHKDIQTTLDIYTSATEKMKRDTMDELAVKWDVF